MRILLLLLGFLVPSRASLCNQCVNNRACVSETQFVPCTNGVAATTPVSSCPQGSNCFRGACLVAYQPGCKVCGQCNAPSGIACVAESFYQLCTDNVPDSSITRPCPTGTRCNPRGTPGVPCYESTSTNNVICSTEVVPSDPPETPIQQEINQFCGTLAIFIRGTVANIPFDYDTTCSVYVKCTLSETNEVSGQLEACPQGQLFNPEEAQCVSSTQFTCPSTV